MYEDNLCLVCSEFGCGIQPLPDDEIRSMDLSTVPVRHDSDVTNRLGDPSCSLSVLDYRAHTVGGLMQKLPEYWQQGDHVQFNGQACTTKQGRF